MKDLFGKLADGTEIHRWSLENGGTRMKVLSYGGIVQSLEVPDRAGRYANVSLGFADLDDYVERSPFFGALIGRYGNRVGPGGYVLDGTAYTPPANDGANSLHGGPLGFDKAVWEVEPFTDGTDAGLRLTHTSPDGDMGHPGTLRTTVTYTLDAAGVWRIDYEAVTDRPTVVNLTNHVYWNLAGEGSGPVDAHELEIAASRYTPVDAGLVPTGEFADVTGTPFDFRRRKTVGADLRADHEQLRYAAGFDHNLVLDKGVTDLPERIATLRDPHSGRTLELATTEPGVQLYSGNFLDGTLTGTSGTVYGRNSAVCLETQHFPDSPNRPEFPPTVLRPGETYRSATVHVFGT